MFSFKTSLRNFKHLTFFQLVPSVPNERKKNEENRIKCPIHEFIYTTQRS